MDEEIIQKIAEALMEWYAHSGRKALPWRGKETPQLVLIVEFLLQRTKAENVARIYNDFMYRYGDFKRLALATPQELRLYFKGLGLFYRGNRLIQVARIIINEYGGETPCKMEELLKLPGVGVYIASAVLNFGCNVPTPVVDKNVIRVLNRLVGITKEVDAREFIGKLYEHGDHKTIAYSLIDLGALICKVRPACNRCPLREICLRYPLDKENWKMLRKVIDRNGEIRLQEQPSYPRREKKTKTT